MSSRTWIKLYCDNWISGSLREEKLEVRGIWASLLALAGSGLYGDTGEIMIQNGVGLTDSQFQKVLHLSRKQWLHAKKRLLDSGRITVDGQNAIRIINWQKYQSEYNRTKKYRTKSTPESTPEREIEIDKERESENPQMNIQDGIDTIFKKVREYMGYPEKPDPIADPKSESSHILNMLERGFTADTIYDTWQQKVRIKGSYVSMRFISEDIASLSPNIDTDRWPKP